MGGIYRRCNPPSIHLANLKDNSLYILPGFFWVFSMESMIWFLDPKTYTESFFGLPGYQHPWQEVMVDIDSFTSHLSFLSRFFCGNRTFLSKNGYECYERFGKGKGISERYKMVRPIGSMYGMFTYIYHKNQPNLGKSSLHGSYGVWCLSKHLFDCRTWCWRSELVLAPVACCDVSWRWGPNWGCPVCCSASSMKLVPESFSCDEFRVYGIWWR